MTIPLESIPAFTADEALEMARRHYGLSGSASPLPSERDQNFCLRSGDGRRFVLKIANRDDTPELLEFQNEAMRRVAAHGAGCRVQRVVSSLRGVEIVGIDDPRTGAAHLLRLFTWIDGRTLADCGRRDAVLLESIGTALARVDAALYGLVHPSMNRVLQWDLRRADMAHEGLGLLTGERRTRVDRIFRDWESIDWSSLRQSVIHGDANDHNVLVDAGVMAGLLDFGDVVHSATVCDLAVALAYVMLGEHDPLSAAAHVILAYHRRLPLADAEQEALYPLILSRLGMSVCYAAHNRARNPDDPYQVVSEAAAWELLGRLAGCTAAQALSRIRDAARPDDGG